MGVEVKGEETTATGRTLSGCNRESERACPMQIGLEREKGGPPADILGLDVGVYPNMTDECVMCGLNMLWWIVLSSDSQVNKRTHFSYPHRT